MSPRTTPTPDTPAAHEARVAALATASGAGRRDFRDRDLREANLEDIDLRGAQLQRAVLNDALLRGTDLRGADLTRAGLAGADLHDATLTDAVLTGANLSRVQGLTLAQLQRAETRAIVHNLYSYLVQVPDEVPGLLAALQDGRINGTTYGDGDCACLAGTCERLRACAIADTYEASRAVSALMRLRASASPRERWFLVIVPDDRPDTNPIAALSAAWLRAWLADPQVREPYQARREQLRARLAHEAPDADTTD